MNTTIDTHKNTTPKATNTLPNTVSGRVNGMAYYCIDQRVLFTGYDLLRWLKAEAEMNKVGRGAFLTSG